MFYPSFISLCLINLFIAYLFILIASLICAIRVPFIPFISQHPCSLFLCLLFCVRGVWRLLVLLCGFVRCVPLISLVSIAAPSRQGNCRKCCEQDRRLTRASAIHYARRHSLSIVVVSWWSWCSLPVFLLVILPSAGRCLFMLTRFCPLLSLVFRHPSSSRESEGVERCVLSFQSFA